MYFSELHQSLLQVSVCMRTQKGNIIICISSSKKWDNEEILKNENKYKLVGQLGSMGSNWGLRGM